MQEKYTSTTHHLRICIILQNRDNDQAKRQRPYQPERTNEVILPLVLLQTMLSAPAIFCRIQCQLTSSAFAKRQ